MRWSTIILISLALACSKKGPPAPAEEAEAEAPAEQTEPAPAEEAKGVEPSATETEGEPAAEQPSLPPELEAETPPIGDPPAIVVLDKGKEPRQALAWKLKPGLEQKLSLKLGSHSTALVAVLKMQSPPFTARYRLALKSEAAEPTGALRVAFTIEKASAKYDYPRPGQGDHLKPAAIAMKGVRGSYTFTSRGTVDDVRVDLPSDASRTVRDMADNLAWALTRMVPVLPEVPVGEGAKWTVHRGIEQGGIQVNELSTMEVTKRQGSRVDLKMQVEQAATEQSYEPPGGTGPIKLDTLWAEAEGTVTLNLERLTPISASATADIRKSGSKRGPKGGKPAPLVIHTNRSLEIPAK